jgi:hypothetical protein
MAKKKASEPEEGHSWLEKYKVEDWENFEPVLDRLSTERRVLGHISDEDHVGRGPRNTVDRLAQELAEDPNTAVEYDEQGAVQGYLDTLEEEGLVEQTNGVYSLTELGFTELAN